MRFLKKWWPHKTRKSLHLLADSYYDCWIRKYRHYPLARLEVGDCFLFDGITEITCEKFSIMFMINKPDRDIALYINPRLPQNYIVRNSRLMGRMGKPENSSTYPFTLTRGRNFMIQIVVTTDYFLIALNGFHFAKFHHRLPFKRIDLLEICGDLHEVNVKRSRVSFYPKRFPGAIAQIETLKVKEKPFQRPTGLGYWHILKKKFRIILQNMIQMRLPFLGKFVYGYLMPGFAVQIDGRVKTLPHSFRITFQEGVHIWPHPLVAYQMLVIFSRGDHTAKLQSGAWKNGAWTPKQVASLPTNFQPGKVISIHIVCEKKWFGVYINNEMVTEFKYVIDPILIDSVYIVGDIKLSSVKLDINRRLPSDKLVRRSALLDRWRKFNSNVNDLYARPKAIRHK